MRNLSWLPSKTGLIAQSLALSCLIFICSPAFAVQTDGAITLANGKCLDADSASWNANGGHVQVWDCNQNPNQTWHYDSTNSTIKSDNGLCLDADSRFFTADGGPVQVPGGVGPAGVLEQQVGLAVAVEVANRLEGPAPLPGGPVPSRQSPCRPGPVGGGGGVVRSGRAD